MRETVLPQSYSLPDQLPDATELTVQLTPTELSIGGVPLKEYRPQDLYFIGFIPRESNYSISPLISNFSPFNFETLFRE